MYNYLIDYWSFGVLVYEMLSGRSPFHGEDEEQVFHAILTAPVVFPNSMSDAAKSFIRCLLERDTNKRLGSETSPYGRIRSQPFFLGKIDWPRLEKREVEPPYKPKLKSPMDLSYVDTEYTSLTPRLSKLDGKLLKTIDDSIFRGFSFTSGIMSNYL